MYIILGLTIGGWVSSEHSTYLVVRLSEGLFQYLGECVDMICPGSHVDSQLVDRKEEGGGVCVCVWGGGEDGKQERGVDCREGDM